MCFDPHPTSILAPKRAPVLLTSLDRRIELLKEAGCDDVVVLPFDQEFARTPPAVFVDRVLVEACNAKGVVIGPDFHFGHRRSGNVDTLRKIGADVGFEVEVVAPVMYRGEAVSSTRIRRILRDEGAVEDAAKMMTRAHEAIGRVVRGDERGRSIGFPTANLDVEPLLLPQDGVYSVVARVLDDPDAPLLDGVANLGVRPTFRAGRSVEVHFFGFDGNLYGKTMRVGFISRIRGERKFESPQALREQIGKDCQTAQNALKEASRDLLRWI
jgi:riboflavin kinase/FMN adenylyltransferase